MPEPALSIVVPVLNEAAGVVACLNALAPLRAQGVEVVVVDGGSTDNTLALAQGLADAVLPGPRGRARQMNTGAAAAQGQVLLFLHADTTLPANAVPAVLEALGQGAQWGRFDVRITGRSPLLHMVALSMIDPDSLATPFATSSNGMTTQDRLNRSGWWMLFLSISSVAAHLVMLVHVRSTAPSPSG